MPDAVLENRLAVDIGGTFTDVVLETPAGRTTTKVLTTHAAPDSAVMRGISQVLERSGTAPASIALVLHGTTLATNALIERKGARTALLTTGGFRDILEMGFEKRFAQYNLDARRPAPLVPRELRFGVHERITAKGEVVVPLDEQAVRGIARKIRSQDVEAVAIGFLHAYAHPQHERAAAAIITEELPEVCVSVSSEVCPEMREYERFSTTVANAYVQPMMAGYLLRLQQRLLRSGFDCPTFLMMSGGGLTTLEQAVETPIRLVESGPAGGAILAADIANARGMKSVLAFDMGGTTAKVALIENGEPDRSRRFEIAREYRDMKGSGLPVRIPVIEMVEIGAGGGSIARIDEMGRIKVGPDSAGSDPGPVAYGLGGVHPTVTDANLVLGKIDAASFAGGSMALDNVSAMNVVQETVGDPLSMEGIWPAAGSVDSVEENMANAARVHAVERGREPSEYTMIAFGGGAPLHAARLADKLGINRVVVPTGAGVGSAIGFLRAPVSYQVVRSYPCILGSADLVLLDSLLASMAAEAIGVAGEAAPPESLVLQRQVDIRYRGQGHELAIALPQGKLQQGHLSSLRVSFEVLYKKVYGLTMPEAELECVSWSVTATTAARSSPEVETPVASLVVSTSDYRLVYDASAGGLVEHAIVARSALGTGATLAGPAIIHEKETTTIVPCGFELRVDSAGALWLERHSAAGISS